MVGFVSQQGQNIRHICLPYYLDNKYILNFKGTRSLKQFITHRGNHLRVFAFKTPFFMENLLKPVFSDLENNSFSGCGLPCIYTSA